MRDSLLKGLICDKRVRVYLCKTTDLCEVARFKHDLWPTSAAALGRVLSVGTVLGGMIKNTNEKVTIQINGNGSIGTIMAEAYPNGRVKGFVGDPHLLLIDNNTHKLAVGKIVGTDGYLRVIKDLGLKSDFVGTVKLVSGEIGEDFAYYFTVSEQIPTAVSVGVLVNDDGSIKSAGALIIQMMPEATEADITYCEEIIKNLAPISELIDKSPDLNDLLMTIFGDVDILEQIDLKFECDCSKERMAEALATINKAELLEMIAEDHGCEIVCQYCSKKYNFSEEELIRLVNEKKENVDVENS